MTGEEATTILGVDATGGPSAVLSTAAAADARGRTTLCQLAARSGRREVCTEACPLWEHGGCSVAELSIDFAEPDEWRDDEPIAPLVVPPPT